MEHINISEFKELTNEIRELLKGQKVKNIIGIKEVSALTGLSVSTIYKKTSKRLIPFHKAPGGKNLFFKREDVEQFLLEREFKTNDELEAEAVNYCVIGKKRGGAK